MSKSQSCMDMAFDGRTPGCVSELIADAFDAVESERLQWHHGLGRVTAEAISADRNSPAIDVSAMDGYAVRESDFDGGVAKVVGAVAIGKEPPMIGGRGVMQIVTGAPVPEGYEAVIPVECVARSGDEIKLNEGVEIVGGQHIRRAGENLKSGEVVLEKGAQINAPVMAGLASFGYEQVEVYQPVRLGLLITGDELYDIGEEVAPWQLRDSNGPTLAAMFGTLPYVNVVAARHVKDDAETLRDAVNEVLPMCDALLMTGGVSMGPFDYVPKVVSEAGCETLFHKIPIRPGKPMLAAKGPEGQMVFGLPGNPVSVMVTARRFAAIALRKRAGFAEPNVPGTLVKISNPDTKTLPLTWYRNVELKAGSEAELLMSKGSGDLVSAARSTGFVEVPVNRPAEGMLSYYPWSV